VRALARVIAIGVLACVAGCGSATPEPRTADAPPLVDDDPAPYVPRADAPGALVLGSRSDEARAFALRFIAALRDGDGPVLEAMLAEHVGACFPSLTPPTRPRDQIVTHALNNPQRVSLGPEVSIDTLIDVDAIETRPLREGTRRLPHGYDPDDVLVSMPLRPDGRQSLRALMPGWGVRAVVVVRGGATPVILAL
jgi:hypothetical protein